MEKYYLYPAIGILVLLVPSILGNAYAASFDVQPRSVASGTPLHFSIIMEGTSPDGFVPGGELARQVRINGPCTTSIEFGTSLAHYGLDYELDGPLPGWASNFPCFLTLRPGEYVASLDYRLVEADLTTHIHTIDVPFTVFGDIDNDGVPDANDNCPSNANPGQEDADEDNIGNACDPDYDRDGDGVLNDDDNCPDVPNPDQLDSDNDGLGFVCDPNDFDGDNDGIDNDLDNCPTVFNPFQDDSDNNGTGDACETDLDHDGVPNTSDNCPLDPNSDQLDGDHNGFGDACDEPDRDDDGLTNDIDNCPDTPNPDQLESDFPPDGAGDACDPPDTDGDGITNDLDNCPNTENPAQFDEDGDGQGDLCDEDYDPDGDGLTAAGDNCIFQYNPDQHDANDDGAGDACDPWSDTDADGLNDMQEYQINTDPNTFTDTEDGINMYSDGDPIDSANEPEMDQEVDVAVVPPEEVDAVQVTVTDPNGDVFFQDTLIPESPVVFSFIPDKLGEWTVTADFLNGTVLTETLSVTFFVIPESPIGVIALVSASLAALGTFFVLRRKQRNSQSHSLGDLGI